MSFGGLILTNQGRNKLAAAVNSEDTIKFTHVQLGDGTYNGPYNSKTALSNKVMEIPVARVSRSENEVIIDCDWDSKSTQTGFYLREIGMIGNGVLFYYDNCGAGDAEYIEPQSEVITKQKRFRFKVYVSAETNITTYAASGLYALADEMKEAMSEKYDKTGGLISGDLCVTGNIGYQGAKAKHDMIKWVDSKNDAYGNGVVIGGGGLTIIGGGESSDLIASQYDSGGSEDMAIASDNAIDFYVNCNNGIDSAIHTQIDKNGNYTGNASSATKWATAHNINGMSIDGSENRANYASCSTAAATVAKIVACEGFSLVTGAEITVKFTTTNTAANPTLNVNNTGAKQIYYRGVAINAGYLAANHTYTFRYNGTRYELVGDINTDTTYSTASTTSDGLMSRSDKVKLNKIDYSMSSAGTSKSVTIDAGRNCIAMGIGWNSASDELFLAMAQVKMGTLTDVRVAGQCGFSLSGNTLTIGNASGVPMRILLWKE